MGRWAEKAEGEPGYCSHPWKGHASQLVSHFLRKIHINSMYISELLIFHYIFSLSIPPPDIGVYTQDVIYTFRH